MTITPTDEQLAAVEAFRKGDSIVVEAGAGAAKTTTCILMADALKPKRGTYVVFNKAMAVEAQSKMPAEVACSTVHSLAFRAVGRRYSHRLKGGRMRSDQIAARLGILSYPVGDGKDRKMLPAGFLAGVTMKALRRFTFSAELVPEPRHFQYIDGIDPMDNGQRTYQWNDLLKAYLLPALKRAWADMQNPDGQLPYQHDCYLKTWALERPTISGDFIVVDEVQDFSPVMLGVMGDQRAQVALVGDGAQQIYEWRGSINALSAMPDARRLWLSHSFRFGQSIADVANALLAQLPDTPLRLTGRGGPSSVWAEDRNEPPDCILTRTNARAVGHLLTALDEDVAVYLVGGGSEVLSFARAAAELQRGGDTSHPDLACFLNWAAVQEYVEQDPQGEELTMLVRLIDKYGAAAIVEAIEQSCSEEKNAELVVSTAHKAKGREWNAVKIADDFTPRKADEDGNVPPLSEPEVRLAYVATTRARHTLDLSSTPHLNPNVTMEKERLTA